MSRLLWRADERVFTINTLKGAKQQLLVKVIMFCGAS